MSIAKATVPLKKAARKKLHPKELSFEEQDIGKARAACMEEEVFVAKRHALQVVDNELKGKKAWSILELLNKQRMEAHRLPI